MTQKKNTVGDADVGSSSEASKKKSAKERKRDQGLVESMAGSDPVSVTQPLKPSGPN